MELLQKTIKSITPVKEEWKATAQARLDSLTKPVGSLGRLEEFARRIVGITEDPMPVIDKKVIFVFAADHGVVEEGVSAYPKEVTPQMVQNFLAGGAGINVLARHAGSEVVIVDMGVDFDFGGIEGLVDRKVMKGTRNFVRGPAMSREEAVQCLEAGIELADTYASKGCKMMGTGDMGIGNTTPSSAIAAVITGREASEVTGRGTGVSDEGLSKKIAAIKEGIRVNKPDPKDGIDVLMKVGGAEIGGIAGLILGAASHRIPVVVDGLISTAGALIAYALQPHVKDYIFAAHNSVEQGHRLMLETMGLTPIIDLGLRLGEGTGGALAMLLIEGGLKVYKEMATFEEAGVSEASD
ncbi:MAG TPA: nicotinate-nucleotide--dimethylbenzimidazole phosphoribosyltransferase [Syntrophorhabdaceae bacterium]|jgi:nicotinate-nucleotide--dimethylbenzimidazole phosphoribosyltransferase